MSREYLTYLHDLFSDFAPVTTRAMFGGHGVYRGEAGHWICWICTWSASPRAGATCGRMYVVMR